MLEGAARSSLVLLLEVRMLVAVVSVAAVVVLVVVVLQHPVGKPRAAVTTLLLAVAPMRMLGLRAGC